MGRGVAGLATESAATTQTFGVLEIGKRVLITPSRTMSIRNIATVSVGTHVTPRSVLQLIAGVILALMAVYILASGISSFGPRDSVNPAVILGILSLGFLVLYFRPDDKTHYLLVSTSDGVLSRFTGPDRAVLEEVRHILTEKINADDQSSTFNINFETGTIENFNVKHAEQVTQSTHVTGSGHTVAGNGATAVSGTGNTVTTANGGNGRIATADTAYSASRSPGAQQGNGHKQNGAAHGFSEIHIDFAQHLPHIVDMHRFYAGQPNAQHLEQRLHELELLMRSGAASPRQKSRIRELSGDLAQILQAYPPVVQLFQQIAGLAGV
jgi:hypothetical protein